MSKNSSDRAELANLGVVLADFRSLPHLQNPVFGSGKDSGVRQSDRADVGRVAATATDLKRRDAALLNVGP